MTIKLPVYDIVIETDTPREWAPGAFNGGSIRSKLTTNGEPTLICAAMDAIESFILAAACAGIDVTTPAFIEAIETAVNAAEHYYAAYEEEHGARPPTWYHDGVESGEDLWRMDLPDDIQVQLFREALQDDRVEHVIYGDQVHVFIEHDVRNEEGNRVKYSGQDFKLSLSEFESLIASNYLDVLAHLAEQIETVKELPDDPTKH